jgi:PAS domain S-box-containing protein
MNDIQLPLRLEEVFNAIGASLLLINRDHTIAWANRVAEERYGDLASIRGAPCHKTAWQFNAPCSDCLLAAAASGEVCETVQLRRSPKGETRYNRVVVVPIRDEHGEATQFLEMTMDVTPIKQLEREAREQNEIFATVVSNTADGILTLDRENRILSWNHGAELIFGYKPQEIIGQSFVRLVPEKLREQGELDRLVAEVREKGYIRNYEAESCTKDGRTIVINLTWTALHGSDGEFIGSSAIIRDVTEQQKVQFQLLQSEKLSAMGILAAGIAHEIGNPLSSMSSLVQLLQRQSPDQRTESQLKLIREQIDRMAKIVRNIRDFAHPPTYEKRPIQINELIENALAISLYSSRAKAVEIRTELDPDLPAMHIVGDQLLQVFLNLVLNAFDAMKEGGQLTVSSHAKDSQACIRFTDTGTGIPHAIQKNIFEPFFTTKEVGKGTGLGLAVSYGIVKNFGGDILVESVVGKGSTFTVVLPIRN